jgi:2Fe-2S ferredoxin
LRVFKQHQQIMYTIHFTFEEKEIQPVTVTSPDGDTLLEVAIKNDIHLHHNCGGVCACSTCQIYLEQGEEFVDEMTDKEEDFIDRARNPRLTSRLACQCLLNEGSGELSVMIPDQSGILGE